MLQSVDAAKTHEIMARFRPIAPKPQLPPSSGHCLDSPSAALLRARPCRTRRRGRADCLIPVPNKRPKALLPVLPHAAQLSGLGLSAQGFARGLSILPPSPARAPALVAPPPPVEQDLLKKLQEPKVIVPTPVRPVGSSISVGCISRGPPTSSLAAVDGCCSLAVSKRPEEVEEEVESVAEPAVISDSNNRVRLANSAYKEMVGQPECLWLETMASASSDNLGLKKASAAATRRINGNVKLDLSGSSEIPVGASGFSCRVKIEWACNGRRSSVDAPCDVSRLHCDSKDYKFTWRIHTAAGFRTNCVA